MSMGTEGFLFVIFIEASSYCGSHVYTISYEFVYSQWEVGFVGFNPQWALGYDMCKLIWLYFN